MKVLVLNARQYKFNDAENPEKVIKGTKITYISEKKSNGDVSDFAGAQVMSISAGYDLFNKITTLPGMYEMELSVYPGKGGKTSVNLENLEFIEEVDLFA